MAENNIKKGKFIVFEGIDGCGKSTQIKHLKKSLEKAGIPAEITAEPTGGDIGRLIRRYLSGEKHASPETLALLFAADRIEHIRAQGGIADLLERGITVLCDRYYLSSFAYQAERVGMQNVISFNSVAVNTCPPDLTVYLDLGVEDALGRIDGRGEREIFEEREILTKIKEHYKEAIDILRKRGENIVTFGSAGAVKHISEKILEAVMPLYNE